MSRELQGHLALFDAGPKGLGVHAIHPIPAGEVVLCFRGPMVPLEDVRDFTHCIQVDPSHYLGASGGLDDYVNHSCDPNCGLRFEGEDLLLVALRDLEAGEEVSFDYSTCLVAEPPLDSCGCGSARCRGKIEAFQSLPTEMQERYLEADVVPAFVRNA